VVELGADPGGAGGGVVDEPPDAVVVVLLLLPPPGAVVVVVRGGRGMVVVVVMQPRTPQPSGRVVVVVDGGAVVLVVVVGQFTNGTQPLALQRWGSLTAWAVTTDETWYEPSKVTTTDPPGPTCTGKPEPVPCTSPPLGKVSMAWRSEAVSTDTRTIPVRCSMAVPG
jgi:hypothetical protein